jgi:hypothetical protein
MMQIISLTEYDVPAIDLANATSAGTGDICCYPLLRLVKTGSFFDICYVKDDDSVITQLKNFLFYIKPGTPKALLIYHWVLLLAMKGIVIRRLIYLKDRL